MSMTRTSAYLSICETLREINDLFQGDTKKDRIVRKKLAEAEDKAKDMSIHLHKYEPEYYKKWQQNVNANSDDVFRSRETYKFYKIENKE